MQQPTARTGARAEAGAKTAARRKKVNTQAVAIPVHLSFPHSTTFEGTKQKQTLFKERQRKER